MKPGRERREHSNPQGGQERKDSQRFAKIRKDSQRFAKFRKVSQRCLNPQLPAPHTLCDLPPSDRVFSSICSHCSDFSDCPCCFCCSPIASPWSLVPMPFPVPWSLFPGPKSLSVACCLFPVLCTFQRAPARTCSAPSTLSPRVHVCARKRFRMGGADRPKARRPRGIKNLEKTPHPRPERSHLRAQMLSHPVKRNRREVGCHAQASVCLSVPGSHQGTRLASKPCHPRGRRKSHSACSRAACPTGLVRFRSRCSRLERAASAL